MVGTASHWSASRDLLKVEMTEKMQRLRRICSSSTQFCHRDTGLKNPIRMEEAATKLAAFTSDTGMKTRAGNSSLGQRICYSRAFNMRLNMVSRREIRQLDCKVHTKLMGSLVYKDP